MRGTVGRRTSVWYTETVFAEGVSEGVESSATVVA